MNVWFDNVVSDEVVRSNEEISTEEDNSKQNNFVFTSVRFKTKISNYYENIMNQIHITYLMNLVRLYLKKILGFTPWANIIATFCKPLSMIPWRDILI